MINLANFDNKNLNDISQAKRISEGEIYSLAQNLGITPNFNYKEKIEGVTEIEKLREIKKTAFNSILLT